MSDAGDIVPPLSANGAGAAAVPGDEAESAPADDESVNEDAADEDAEGAALADGEGAEDTADEWGVDEDEE